MDEIKVWHKFLEEVKSQVGPTHFKGWFTSTTLESLDDKKMVISTPSAFIKETLSLRHLPLMESILEQLLGKKVKIEFSVNPTYGKTPLNSQEEEDEEEDNFFQPGIPINPSPLNPKYTLENFVVGLTNNLAYAAALAVIQNPGTSYNPLYIYGPSGVGKTHIMQAIGNNLIKKNPYLKMVYAPSEKFTNNLIESIQSRKMADFRNKYRSADLLLIDDVQFFSGKDSTQEEFFHTFNDLHSKNAQLVFTSDRPPHEIDKLEDRLKSRFQGGLMVDIQLPDFDTRVAILKAKCKERGESVSDEVLNIIAAAMETNARELEGKLIQVLQILKIQNQPPTPEIIQSLLGHKKTDNLQTLSHKQVLNRICEYFNIRLTDLTGPRRSKDLVLPRHLVMHILSEDLKMTVEKIGEVLGGRDHTTVMHGRDKIKRLITTDREVQKIFIEVRQNLSSSS